MKPWEIKKTRNKLKKMSKQKSIEMFFDLYIAGIKILKTFIRKENPRSNEKQVKIKMNKLIKAMGNL